MKCTSCNFQNRAGVRYCENCGQLLPLVNEQAKLDPEPAGQVCSRCGENNRIGVVFCEACGNPFSKPSTPVKPTPRRSVASPKQSKSGTGACGMVASALAAMLCLGIIISSLGISFNPFASPAPGSSTTYSSSSTIDSSFSESQSEAPHSESAGVIGVPGLTISPKEGPIPTSYRISLTGFSPYETVLLEVYSVTLGTTVLQLQVDVDEQGRGTTSFQSDDTDTPGRFLVFATGATSNSEVNTEFVISGSASANSLPGRGNVQVIDSRHCGIPKNLYIALNPEEGGLGTTYELCLGHFDPNEIVQVSIGTIYPLARREVLTFDLKMNSQGWGAVTFVPDSADGFPTGTYHVSAVGVQSGKTDSLDTFFGLVGNSPTTYKIDVQWFQEIIDEYWRQTFPQIWPSRTYATPTFIAFVPPLTFNPCPSTPAINPDDYWEGAWACRLIPDNFIFWSDPWMLDFYQRYGSETAFITLAHEWGHRLLRMASIDFGSVSKQEELMADCLSGAAYGYARSEHAMFDQDSDLAIFYFIGKNLSDDYMAEWVDSENFDDQDASAHGTRLERQYAFYSGYTKGPVEGCSLVPQP